MSKVIVHVQGGNAMVAQNPEGVEVSIIDFDNLNSVCLGYVVVDLDTKAADIVGQVGQIIKPIGSIGSVPIDAVELPAVVWLLNMNKSSRKAGVPLFISAAQNVGGKIGYVFSTQAISEEEAAAYIKSK